jgi:hypothetical protein
MNRRIANHPLVGHTLTYRPDLPAYDPDLDREGGVLVLGNGMPVIVKAAFENWNDVPGLDMLYVFVPATGMHTHQSPKEMTGWDAENLATLVLGLPKVCDCEAEKGRYSTHLPTCPAWVCDGLPLAQTKCLDKAAHM